MFTSIDSVEKLNDFIESNNATPETTKTIILLFTGTKNSAGKSWCPDCNVADPIIEKVHNDLNDPNLTIATVFVGDLSSWKNGENPFRRHPKFQVNCVPTLIHLEKNQRLEEAGCADEELVQRLFQGSLNEGYASKTGVCTDGVCRLR